MKQQQEESEIQEEKSMSSMENMSIGDEKEKKHYPPGKVVIKSWEVKDRQGNECLIFNCRHPSSKELIQISGIKLKRYDRLKVNGIWLGADEDGNIPYDSALAVLLRVAEVHTVKGLVDKELQTEIQSYNNPMLCFKGY